MEPNASWFRIQAYSNDEKQVEPSHSKVTASKGVSSKAKMWEDVRSDIKQWSHIAQQKVFPCQESGPLEIQISYWHRSRSTKEMW
jgi:hypothetical protein